MEKVPYLGHELTRWQVGNSTFLALPEKGARLMNWNVTLGDGTRAVVFAHLKSILNAAVDDEKIGKNPCLARSVTAPRPVQRKVIPWKAETVSAILNQGTSIYEMGQAAAPIELNVIDWMCKTLGMPAGSGGVNAGGSAVRRLRLAVLRAPFRAPAGAVAGVVRRLTPRLGDVAPRMPVPGAPFRLDGVVAVHGAVAALAAGGERLDVQVFQLERQLAHGILQLKEVEGCRGRAGPASRASPAPRGA